MFIILNYTELLNLLNLVSFLCMHAYFPLLIFLKLMLCFRHVDCDDDSWKIAILLVFEESN